ncbi:MAG: OmpW family outer membrane protein [Lonepinella koalarum]|nr:OmpW family outer membrane protein [Lonepinella koalarum]
MKKTLLAVLFGAFAVASTANANWYAQADLGYAKVKTSNLNLGDLNEGTFNPAIAVGYDFGDWRLAVDYSHYGKINNSYRYTDASSTVTGSSSLRVTGLGVSAIYDFNINSAISPYVGVRLAQNLLNIQDSSTEVAGSTVTHYNEKEKKTRTGYGIVAGAQYQLAPNWLFNAGVEYNQLGKVEDVKVKQYGLKAGIRFNF